MVIIKRLDREELERLRHIRLISLRDSPGSFCSTYEETVVQPDSWWEEQFDRIASFVAIVEREDAGLVRCVIDETDPSHFWLVSMWVSPNARKMGIGRALIDASVAYAKDAGGRKISLDVAETCQPAIELYKRARFQATGETDLMPPPRNHVIVHRYELLL